MFFYKYILFCTVYVVDVVKRYLFWRPDFKILKAEMDYVHVPVIEEDPELDPVFNGEKAYWDDDQEVGSCVDVTSYAREGTVGDIVIPTSVEQCVVSIWYLYGEKTYRFFTRDLKYVWPPFNPREDTKFIVPIKRAELLDGDMEFVRDVTGKIKKYAGPRNNFFNQEILPDDMFTYSDYKFLRIENILGKEYIVASDGIIRTPW